MTTKNCPYCRGQGVVARYGYTYPEDEDDIVDEQCEICCGTGVVDDEEPL